MSLAVEGIKTSVFKKNESLELFLRKHLQGYSLEGKVLAITSKIISIDEKQFVKKDELSKRELVKKEADVYLGEGGYDIELTIKHGILIPSAGIDESNSEDESYILFPKRPFESAQRIYNFLKKEFQLNNFGVLITDSHCQPLRKGVTGVALSYWGFQPTNTLVGEPDVFGKKLKFTSVNVADSLAVACVFEMGEANEQKPLAIAQSSIVKFTEKSFENDISISPEEDLFGPILFKK